MFGHSPPMSATGARPPSDWGAGDDAPIGEMANQPGSFWAKITGNASGTNRYAWTQIDEGDTTSFDAVLSTAFAATGTSDAEGSPAYEINLRTDVPTGARVRVWPAGDFTYYLFQYIPAPAKPASPSENSVPALTSTGDLANTPQYVVQGTDTVTQYVVPNVGDSPTTSPVLQYVVENVGTPSITQSLLTSGTGYATGLTSTLTPTQHTVSYTINSQTGGYTVTESGGDVVFTYVAGTTVNFSAATVVGVLGGSGTAGKLPKWSSGSALGDSIVTESGAALSVAGDVSTSGAYGFAALGGTVTAQRIESTTRYDVNGTSGATGTDALGNVFTGGIATTVQGTAATARTNLGLAIGTNVQAYDATLAALAAANWAANALPIGSGADTLSQVSFAANTFPARASTGNLVAKTISDDALTFVAAASNSAMRTALGVAIGTNVQGWDADLDALAALSGTNTIYYRSGANTWTAVTIGSGLAFSGGTLSASGSALADGDYGDVVVSGAGTALTVESATGAFGLLGRISPTAIGGTVNDWAPTGLSGASAIHMTESSAATLTGLTGGSAGRVLLLVNAGSYSVTLKDHDGGSTSANQFVTAGGRDVVIPTGGGALLRYDASYWRVIAAHDTVNVATGNVTGVLALANGGAGVSLAGTGGAGQYVKQSSAGATLTVGTIPAADYPDFTVAGASHAKGAVPDPGATAHTNQPYILGDNGWGPHKGELLAISFVTTSETTTAGGPADLTTTQHLTFTLDVSCKLLVEVSACNSNTGTNVNRLTIDVDGSATTVADRCDNAGSNYVSGFAIETGSLSAASHTIKFQFGTAGGTATFFNRCIRVWRSTT